MRNIGGFIAQRKLTRSLIANMHLSGMKYRWLSAGSKEWMVGPDTDTDVETKIRGLSWGRGRRSRSLLFDLTVPVGRNNIDLCLLRCAPEEISSGASADADRYIALGELKGGIDPAGADEHWKTARSALDRIRDAFAKRKAAPQLLFIGAAIEPNMAREIWSMLQDGKLANAANLTRDDQIASLTRWLFSL